MNFLNKKLSAEELEEMKRQEENEITTQEYESLRNRFDKNQPFVFAHARRRRISGGASYFFNVVSALGLFYVVALFLEVIPVPYLNYIFAFAMLVAFEWSKRYFSDSFWDEFYFKLLDLKNDVMGSINFKIGFINFALLFSLSLAGTAYGLYFFTTDASPEAIALKVEIQELKASIAEHESNKKGNRIQWNSEQLLNKELYPKLAQLEIELSEAEASGRTSGDTTEAGISYSVQRSQFRVWSAVLLSILFEILFEICMAFNSKYDYRKMKLLEKQTRKKTTPPSSSAAIPGRPLTYEEVMEIVNKTIKNTWQNMSEHVQTDEKGKLGDKYTIEHTDFVTGEPRRMTLDQIEQNINKYKTRVQEAEENNMKPEVLENRKNKLAYWNNLHLTLFLKLNPLATPIQA